MELDGESSAPPATSHPEQEPQPRLLQSVCLDAEPAAQATMSQFAADKNLNVNNELELNQFLMQPVLTIQDVLEVTRACHKAVIRPEFQGVVHQLERFLSKLSDRVIYNTSNFNWALADMRKEQTQRSSLLILATGFDQWLEPEDRWYILRWAFDQVKAVKQSLRNHGVGSLLDVWEASSKRKRDGYPLFHVLTGDPVTIRQGRKFARISMLTLRSLGVRQVFISERGGATHVPLYSDQNTAVAGHHIKFSIATQQFQRKLEGPLRVCLDVIKNSDLFSERRKCRVLWKGLALMSPQEDLAFYDNTRPCLRLEYQTMRGQMELDMRISEELFDACNEKFTEEERQDMYGDEGATQLGRSWQKCLFGAAQELDRSG